MNRLLWLFFALNINATFVNLYKAEGAVVFVEVKKKSYPKSSNFKEVKHGVIIGEDGYILVNNSLLGESQEASVILNDDRVFKAVVIGRDLKTDLAVLKIDAKKLPKITWAEGVTKGQNIFIIASPYNMRFSLFQSIISSDNRNSKMLGEANSCFGNACEIFSSPLLQYEMSAPTADGILFDEEGKCVGIHTNLFSFLGTYGMYFAIPSQVAKKVAQDLILNGKVVRSYIGVQLQEVDQKLFEAYNMEKVPLKGMAKLFGCVVVNIQKNSPADVAKLKQGDIIVNVDSQLVVDCNMLQDKIVSKAPGSKIMLDIWRQDNSNEKISIKKSFKEPMKGSIKESIEKSVKEKQKNSYKLLQIEVTTKQTEAKQPEIDLNYSKHVGLKLITINEKDKLSLISRNVKDIKNGLLIVDITDNRLAKELQINDIILQIQHKNINTLADFDKEIMRTLKNNEKYIILLVSRKEKIFSCAIEIANVKIENIEKEGK